MRQIKFRAWDGERMKEVLTWGFNEKFISTPKTVDDEENFDIMQFTGLKDRIGVDIYEGDILSIEALLGAGSFVLEVVWDTQLARFTTGNSPLSSYARQSMIIGNIYQNPELLK